ncbi:MAG TPA: trehalose-phosphatase [Gemmatimonadaceae bacterium]|nr:trehalose-phosphatase [Gemmatimonadaceae bacterium]
MNGSARTSTATPHAPPPSHEWAYFFDLDGTLVELVEVPSGVHADDELRSLVGELAKVSDGAVAVITGRAIADIDRIFSGTMLPVAGQHGVERRSVGGELFRHVFPVAELQVARDALRLVVARHPALLLEDKGLSLALHYRQAPRLASYAHRVMRQLREELGDAFCLQRGKRVVELKPAGRDKGLAIREFMAEPPFIGRMPVFVGDDVTDEHGFDVVNALGGLSIKVGRGATRARHQLADVCAVRRWLAQDTQAHGATRPDRARRDQAARTPHHAHTAPQVTPE